MAGHALRGILIGALGIAGTAGAQFAGEFRPESYLRPLDQQRARLIKKPCVKADIGRGCSRYGTRLVRDPPCIYRDGNGAIADIRTDQCFKMEKPRRFRGVWIDEFEGQEFVPEGTTLPDWPRSDPKKPGWSDQLERRRLASIWLDVDQAGLRHDRSYGYPRYRIEFIGRKTMYPGHYGHMGMSGNEIIVDRVISLTPLK